MDSRQLRYFLAIAACENMSAAATELHVSQPALSTALHNLEHEIGVPLFDRHGRHLQINDAGRYLVLRAQSAFKILEEAKESIRTDAAQRQNIVNCAMEIPLGHCGRLVRGFYDQYPGFKLTMGYPDSSQFAHQSIDLTLCGSALRIDGPAIVPLGRESLLIVLPKEHPLAHKPGLKLADLAHDPFILTNPSEMRSLSEAMCTEAGFAPRIAMETQIFSEALGLVEAGIGCAIAAEVTWLANMPFDIVARRPADVSRTRYLYARLPEHEHPSTAALAFLSYLKEYAARFVNSNENACR